MIDIDDFKKVNDTYGHEQGDFVLRTIAEIILSSTTYDCYSYRYGGEELAITCNYGKLELVLTLADRIRYEIENYSWPDGMHVTVSMGVAYLRGALDIVSVADNNLYYTKRHGKNNVCYEEKGEKKLMRNE